MEIYFQDPDDIPVQREKVRIREFAAQPYPDGRRIRVYLEVTPFLNKPDAEITLENSLGEVVTSVSVIETITPKMELTLHVPALDGPGEHTLKAVVFYRIETVTEGDDDGEGPGPYEILEVDRGGQVDYPHTRPILMDFYRRFPELFRPYRRLVLISLAMVLINTPATLLVPLLIERVIDTGLTSGDLSLLLLYSLLIMGIAVVRAAAAFVERLSSEKLSLLVTFDLRNNLYNHIQYLSFTFHDFAQTGQLVSRGIEDVRSVRAFIGSSLPELIRVGLYLIGISIILFIADPRLAAIAMVPILFLLAMTTRFGMKVGKMFLAVDRALGEISSRVQENALGAMVVRAFSRQSYELERFGRANQELYEARVNVIYEWSKIMPTGRVMVSLSVILVLWFGGLDVLAGEMTIGALVAFIGYILILAAPSQQLAWHVNAAGEGQAGGQRIFQVLDEPFQIQPPSHAISLPRLQGRVEFRQVTVHYSGQKIPAIQSVDITALPNEVIALIGATGSGKTTLVNLIPRFYDATQGAVLVDGYDVRDVELRSLRRQIGIVPQSSRLFSVSVRENIAYGRPDAGFEEILEAAKAAQAHDFILGLPDGYDTVVGERGLTLSGGQRQRIAIARALLLDPRILLLDDSTSSVDVETEAVIQSALRNLMAGRTTFVIAHRLSTVRRADRILVMREGQVVQEGSHAELISTPGIYQEIYELQLKNQEDVAVFSG